MKKTAIIIFCLCAFLFAHERRVSFGLRLGGSVGLSAPSEDYKELVLGEWDFTPVYDIDEELPPEWSPCRLEWRDGSGSFDFAPFVSLQLNNLFAIQTEMLFTKYGYIGFDVVKGKFPNGYYIYDNGDTVLTPLENGIRITGHALIFPILAKLTFRPSKFSIQTFVGPHFTVNVGKLKDKEDGKIIPFVTDEGLYITVRQPPVGLTAGANFGVKAGSGTMFFDARYFTDLGYWEWADRPDDSHWFLGRRARLSLTVGYEFGLSSK